MYCRRNFPDEVTSHYWRYKLRLNETDASSFRAKQGPVTLLLKLSHAHKSHISNSRQKIPYARTNKTYIKNLNSQSDFTRQWGLVNYYSVALHISLNRKKSITAYALSLPMLQRCGPVRPGLLLLFSNLRNHFSPSGNVTHLTTFLLHIQWVISREIDKGHSTWNRLVSR